MANAATGPERKVFYHLVRKAARDEELAKVDTFVDTRRDEAQRAGRAPDVARMTGTHRSGRRLRHVDPGAHLYIVGHGRMGQEEIGHHGRTLGIGPRRMRISAEALAEQLERDGLRRSHGVIKVWACWSGVRMPAQEESYARRLARALYRRGYQHCTVDGYAGSVHVEHRDVTGGKALQLVVGWDRDALPDKYLELLESNLDFDGVAAGRMRGLKSEYTRRSRPFKVRFAAGESPSVTSQRPEAVGRVVRDTKRKLWIVIETDETRRLIEAWRRDPALRPGGSA